jgi:hypothetical protein
MLLMQCSVLLRWVASPLMLCWVAWQDKFEDASKITVEIQDCMQCQSEKDPCKASNKPRAKQQHNSNNWNYNQCPQQARNNQFQAEAKTIMDNSNLVVVDPEIIGTCPALFQIMLVIQYHNAISRNINSGNNNQAVVTTI